LQTRSIKYTAHDVRDQVSNAEFQIIEAQSDGGMHHAVAVARSWTSLDVPVDPNAQAPSLSSLHIEDLSLGPNSGVVVCGHIPRQRQPDARSAVEDLAKREGFTVYRWNDEDDAIGGARAMAHTDTHTMSLRVLPYDDVWAFVSAVVPSDRLATTGGALHAALVTFKLFPSWAAEPLHPPKAN
jgi:hypothetical protein